VASKPAGAGPAGPETGLDFGAHLAAAMPEGPGGSGVVDPTADVALPTGPSDVAPEAVVPALLAALEGVPEVDLAVAAPVLAVLAVPALSSSVAPPTPPAPAVTPAPQVRPPGPDVGKSAEPPPRPAAEAGEPFVLEADAPPPRVEAAAPKLAPVVEAAPPPLPGPQQAPEAAPEARPTPDAGPTPEVDTPEFEIGTRVRTAGTKAARVDVPMTDGTTLRAEVSVEDGAVEVKLHGSEELGAMALRDAQELRDGLNDQGLDLAEFEFLTEAEPDAEGNAGGEPAPGGREAPLEFAPADFDPEEEEAQAVLASATQDPELSRGAFVRRRM